MFEEELRELGELREDQVEERQRLLNAVLQKLLDRKLSSAHVPRDIVGQVEDILEIVPDDMIRYRVVHLFMRTGEDFERALEHLEKISPEFRERPLVELYRLVCLFRLGREEQFHDGLDEFCRNYPEYIQNNSSLQSPNSRLEVQKTMFNILELLVYCCNGHYHALEPLLKRDFFLTDSNSRIETHNPVSDMDRYAERFESEAAEFDPENYHVFVNDFGSFTRPKMEPLQLRLFMTLALARGPVSRNDLADCWDRSDDIEDEKITQAISSLRRKFKDSMPDLKEQGIDPIHTAGQGHYKLHDSLTWCVIYDKEKWRNRR